MTEQDKLIQDLRRENARLQEWVDELEAKYDTLDKFITWMKNTAFGPEQYDRILKEYIRDTGGGTVS